MIQMLRQSPAFAEMIRNLSGDLVRIRLPPEAWKGLKDGKLTWSFDKAGNLLPNVIGRKGQVRHKVRLDPVGGGDSLGPLTQLAVLQGLARIEQQLMDLQISIEQVRQGQVDDRMGLLDGGISLFEQALELKDLQRRNAQLHKAVQTLNEVRGQLLRNGSRLIREAGELPTSGLSLWWWSLWSNAGAHERARKLLEQAAEETRGAATATFRMVRAYQYMGEHRAASKALSEFREWWMQHAGTAASAARLIAATEAPLPESMWGPDRLASLGEMLRVPDLEEWEGPAVLLEASRKELSDEEQ
jgi:tetratricopeptide (TPR) repeat protein